MSQVGLKTWVFVLGFSLLISNVWWAYGAADTMSRLQARSEQPSAAEKAAVEEEVGAALAAEKAGFNARDCDAALSHWNDGPLVMAAQGGVRARSRDEMAAYCEKVMAGLPPDLDNRETRAEDVYVLSSTAAYTITQYPDDAIVTKVWNKAGNGWRIVHLHESMSLKGDAGPSGS